VIGKKAPDGRTIGSDADFVMYLLESQNLALLQGEAYGLSPFVRISFAASMEMLEEGCRRLRLACEALR
jgi:aspartate aminotransferase